MRRILCVALLLLPVAGYGQSTSVSAGPIVDTDSLTWINGTYRISFVSNPAYPGPYIWSGGNLQNNNLFTGVLDGTGSFSSISIPDNTTITPSGSQWQFQICPLATSGCVAVTQAVSGSTANLTTALNAAALGPRFSANPIAYGYGTVEVIPTAKPGSGFFDVTNDTYYNWNGFAWQVSGLPSGCFVGGVIPITCGGTGAPTAAGANKNLTGITQTGTLGTSSQVSSLPGLLELGTGLLPSTAPPGSIISAGYYWDGTTYNFTVGPTGTFPNITQAFAAMPLAYGGNTISLQAGVLTQTQPLEYDNPFASFIDLIGATPIVTASTSVASSSGSAGAYSVVVNVTSSAGMTANQDYVTFSGCTGGTNPTYLDGTWAITAKTSGTITVTTTHLTGVPSGSVVCTVTDLPSILDFSTASDGIQVWNLNVLNIQNVTIKGTSSTYACLSAEDNSRIRSGGTVALVGCNRGLVEFYGAEVNEYTSGTIISASSMNLSGVEAFTGAILDMVVISTGNKIDGYQGKQSTLNTEAGSVFSGNTTGIADIGGTILATGTTQVTGNTDASTGTNSAITPNSNLTPADGTIINTVGVGVQTNFAGDVDASGAPWMKLPISAGCTTSASGEICHDSTAHNWHIYADAADNFVAIFSSVSRRLPVV